MSLVTITKIPCEQRACKSYVYELDTNLFNESIFKMCTKCGVFVHDFSDMFCSCGQKLDYVDVSDVDGLKLWLNHLTLNNKPVEEPVETHDSESENSADFDEIDLVLDDDDHICDINEDCSNPDCIDCCEKWGDSPEGSDSGSVTDPDYFLAVVNDKADFDCDCSNCDDNYDDGYAELDSVS